MLIDYTSDLHLDNGLMRTKPVGWLAGHDVTRYRSPAAELLVVAGDTSNHPADTADFLNSAATCYPTVVAIHGNHERMNRWPVTLATNVFLLDEREGHAIMIDDVAFIGACLTPGDAALEVVVEAVGRAQDDQDVRALVIVSHYAPTPLLGEVIGANISHKANDLLARLPAPTKPSVIIFGHLHIELDTTLDGYRLVSNPRGYRARRRDGSTWTGFAQLEI